MKVFEAKLTTDLLSEKYGGVWLFDKKSRIFRNKDETIIAMYIEDKLFLYGKNQTVFIGSVFNQKEVN